MMQDRDDQEQFQQEYLQKLNLIEELKKERAKKLELVGKAHQEAENAEQRKLEEQIAQKEK